MSGYTDAERAAGRTFRDMATTALARKQAEGAATHTVPGWLASLRHRCAAQDHRSVALVLVENYVSSPAFPDLGVPAGRFGFVHRAGRCRACGVTARSAGRLVDGWTRGPLRDSAAHRPVVRQVTP